MDQNVDRLLEWIGATGAWCHLYPWHLVLVATIPQTNRVLGKIHERLCLARANWCADDANTRVTVPSFDEGLEDRMHETCLWMKSLLAAF